jgi:hypothetical protein
MESLAEFVFTQLYYPIKSINFQAQTVFTAIPQQSILNNVNSSLKQYPTCLPKNIYNRISIIFHVFTVTVPYSIVSWLEMKEYLYIHHATYPFLKNNRILCLLLHLEVWTNYSDMIVILKTNYFIYFLSSFNVIYHK